MAPNRASKAVFVDGVGFSNGGGFMTTYFRCDIFRKLCSASVISLLVGLFALPHVVRAQTTSTIEGTVTDKQGLAVSGAEIHVEGSTAGASRSVATDANGAYQIPGLPAGTYKLTVTRDGFRTESVNDLEVTLNRTLKFDVQLQVGSTQEPVEISAEIPLLDTTSSSTGATIVPQEIENMPLNGIEDGTERKNEQQINRYLLPGVPLF
jgi:hypothetical protein